MLHTDAVKMPVFLYHFSEKQDRMMIVQSSTTSFIREDYSMNLGAVFILILYSVIGGFSTLAMVFGIPGVIGWKIYRKIRYGISLTG